MIERNQFGATTSGAYGFKNHANGFQFGIHDAQARRVSQEIEGGLMFNAPINGPARHFDKPIELPASGAKCPISLIGLMGSSIKPSA